MSNYLVDKVLKSLTPASYNTALDTFCWSICIIWFLTSVFIIWCLPELQVDLWAWIYDVTAQLDQLFAHRSSQLASKRRPISATLISNKMVINCSHYPLQTLLLNVWTTCWRQSMKSNINRSSYVYQTAQFENIYYLCFVLFVFCVLTQES